MRLPLSTFQVNPRLPSSFLSKVFMHCAEASSCVLIAHQRRPWRLRFTTQEVDDGCMQLSRLFTEHGRSRPNGAALAPHGRANAGTAVSIQMIGQE
jgi:hypothetical protein